MLNRFAILSILSVLMTCPRGVSAAQNLPHETRNAALRYWMAFAEIQDAPADKETSDLLEKTAAGETSWDEAKLGSVLDKNNDAILIMQRATKLPDCDWGLEYERGPYASIAYAPRARVLARLNTLYGMRLASKGDNHGAVDTWLAGIRFSQDLAKGGTLIFALIAKTGLLSNLNALTQASGKGTLSPSDKAKIATVLGALPETGFDWRQALAYEQSAIATAVKNIKSAAHPEAYYQQLMGAAPPVNLATLSAADTSAFDKVMSSAEVAMRLPPEQTQQQLEALRKSLNALNPVYLQMMPSFVKVNDSRKQIAAAREILLHLTTGK